MADTTTALPNFSGISHISFSSRDADRSAAWWQRVLGLIDLDEVDHDGWRARLLIHPTTSTIIEFQQHDANLGEEFDPTRTGFDHMGFKVEGRDDLVEWQRRFEELGVTHTPVVDRDYGSVLTFKDPDGIQFEMFHREHHP